MTRKDAFRSFLAEETGEGSMLETGQSLNSIVRARSTVLRVKTGPIQHLEADLQALKGEAVLEVNTALIDASFIKDRLDSSDVELEALVESIREHGQQVPAL
jgi:ParB family chromosome partitioning protein